MPLPRHLARARLRAAPAGLLLGVLLVVGGCGGDEHGPYPVEPGREREGVERPVPPYGTSKHRLLPPELVWRTPPGWLELGPDDMRLGSFRVPGEGGDGDVSVSRARGSLAANVNRWRQQMDLPALSPAAVEALPTQPLLGEPAARVDLGGAYTPMGGTARAGWRMLGVALEGRDESLFVKFVGPEALVKANQEAFDALVASVRFDDGTQPPTRSSGAPAANPPLAFDPSELRWTTPPGWTAVKPKTMFRVSDFRIAQAPEVEVVLSALEGSGGGLALNLNRWRQQMGQTELSTEEIDRLERFDMLGTTAVWIEIAGRYTGMSGEDVPEALFVGVICPVSRGTVFVRLVGPREATARQREAFRALCTSLRVEAKK